VERPRVELARGRALDDPPEVHHRDPVADVPDDRQVVRDEQVGEAQPVLEPLEEVDYLRLDRHVEGRDRLIGDDEVGVEGERPRHPDPLSLATRELVRVADRVVGVEPDGGEQLPNPLPSLRLRADVVDVERLGDGVSRGHPRVERGVRVLEDHLEPTAQVLELPPVDGGDVRAVELDRARRGLVQPHDRPPGRALAAARLPDEAKGLALPELEADPVDRAHVADVALDEQALGDREPDLEVLDPEQGVRGGVIVRRHVVVHRPVGRSGRGDHAPSSGP
jgi:hypothetical protein